MLMKWWQNLNRLKKAQLLLKRNMAIEIEDNDLKVKLKKVNDEIARMESLICRLNTFIKEMENSEDLITEFNPKYWVTTLERADVGEDFNFQARCFLFIHNLL